MFAESLMNHIVGKESVSEETKRVATIGMLWTVATAILTASFIGMATLFAWHKETPHVGSLTVQGFNDKVEVIIYRLDNMDAHINEINDAVKLYRRDQLLP